MLNAPPSGNPPNPPGPGNPPAPNLTPAQQQAALLAQAMLNSVNNTINLGLAMRDNTNELLDQVGIYRRINIEDKQHISLNRKVTDSIMLVNAELRRSGQIERQLAIDKRLNTQADVQIGMLRDSMTAGNQAQGTFQISQAQAVLQLKKDQLEAEKAAARLTQQGNTVAASIAKQTADDLEQQFITAEALLNPEQKRLVILSSIKEATEESIRLREIETEKATRINKNLGITGAILENLNKVGARVFGGIGLNLSVLGEGLQIALQDASDRAEALDINPEGKGLFRRQLSVINAAIPGIRAAFIGAVKDPLTIAIGIFTTVSSIFNKIDKASTDVSRLTGQTATAAAIYNTKLASTTQYLSKIVELTQKYGLNAQNVFSEETLAKAAEYQNLLGLSAEEAGGLALQSQLNGQSIDKNVNSIVEQVSQFNKSNRSAISYGVVLKDVANASDGISASMGDYPETLTQAASAARRLGLELNQLDQIANSLLDFESSIEAELTAQLLTGKDINLSRARELALANDLAGVGKELFENSASLAEFGQMNRIAQEEYARALGMTRDQLARTAYQRALEIGMTNEQAAAAANVNAEDMKRMAIQESIALSFEKIGDALAGPLNLMAELVSHTAILGTLLIGIGLISISKLIVSIITLKASLMAAGFSASWLKLALGGIAAAITMVVGYAIINSLFNQAESKVESIKDGVLSKKGIMYRGDKGDIRLDKDDSALVLPDGRVIAGTKLREDLQPSTIPSSQLRPGQNRNNFQNSTIKVENNNSELIALLKEVVNNTQKTATYTKNPTILDPGKLILSQQMYQTTV